MRGKMGVGTYWVREKESKGKRGIGKEREREGGERRGGITHTLTTIPRTTLVLCQVDCLLQPTADHNMITMPAPATTYCKVQLTTTSPMFYYVP